MTEIESNDEFTEFLDALVDEGIESEQVDNDWIKSALEGHAGRSDLDP